MDYYELLQVDTKATTEEIRSAYKKLVKIYHPDVCKLGKDECEERIYEINEAYTVLADEEKRKLFNKTHVAIHEDFEGENGDYFHCHKSKLSLNKQVRKGVSIEVTDPYTNKNFIVPIPKIFGAGKSSILVEGRGVQVPGEKKGVRGNLHVQVIISKTDKIGNLADLSGEFVTGVSKYENKPRKGIKKHWWKLKQHRSLIAFGIVTALLVVVLVALVFVLLI